MLTHSSECVVMRNGRHFRFALLVITTALAQSSLHFEVHRMSQAKHTTAARSQFAKEFAAALSAIKTLDSRDSAWASVPLPKRKPTAAEILRTQPWRGQETTFQLSFASPAGAPKQFAPTMTHRRRRDEETDWVESIFQQRNLFGMKP